MVHYSLIEISGLDPNDFQLINFDDRGADYNNRSGMYHHRDSNDSARELRQKTSNIHDEVKHDLSRLEQKREKLRNNLSRVDSKKA